MLAEILAEVATHAGLSGVTCLFGGKHMTDLRVVPFIVWIPSSDSVGPPDHNIQPEYKAIRTRLAGVEAHIIGFSYQQVEAILHNMVLACHVFNHGSFQAGSIQWTEAQKGNIESIWEAVVNLTFDIPMLNKPISIPATPSSPVVNPGDDTSVVVTVVEQGTTTIELPGES